MTSFYLCFALFCFCYKQFLTFTNGKFFLFFPQIILLSSWFIFWPCHVFYIFHQNSQWPQTLTQRVISFKGIASMTHKNKQELLNTVNKQHSMKIILETQCIVELLFELVLFTNTYILWKMKYLKCNKSKKPSVSTEPLVFLPTFKFTATASFKYLMKLSFFTETCETCKFCCFMLLFHI